MNVRRSYLQLCLVIFLATLALMPTRARAEHDEEDVTAHSKHPLRTIVLDNTDIRPSTLTLERGDALVFENHSQHGIKTTFIEPENMVDKIRCGLIRPNEKEEPKAPWQLFVWADGKLSATIPPGRFASVCSLMAGNYTFTATPLTAGAKQTEGGGVLPKKGQIVVK